MKDFLFSRYSNELTLDVSSYSLIPTTYLELVISPFFGLLNGGAK